MAIRPASPLRLHAALYCRRTSGFSLLEMMISLAVLLIVTGAVFEQIIQMERKSAAEEIKIDTAEQAREFVDQMMRDLHMAGYPNAAMYSAPLDNTSPLVAAGLVSVSPTQIILEGDVDNNGQVESVNVGYIANSSGDPNCPCIRRSAVPKAAGDPLAQPVQAANYSETGHVIPPGIGPGKSGDNLFTFYDQRGNPVIIGAGTDINSNPDLIKSIKTVKINLTLLTSEPGAGAGDAARTSLSATARLDQ
jgi:prepilin-type N-terminal cleavage/methylation domain-containing protein